MRHLQTEARARIGIGFMHHKFFDFVNFDSATSIKIKIIFQRMAGSTKAADNCSHDAAASSICIENISGSGRLQLVYHTNAKSESCKNLC